MPIALRHRFNSGQTPAGSQKDPVTRIARIVLCGAVLVAGGYFALVYLLTGR